MSRKMYKQGLKDALETNEALSAKQEAALKEMRRQVEEGMYTIEQGLGKLGDDINGIYRYLTSREKAALYHMSTPMSIQDLEEEERKFLVAVLYRLANDEDEATEDQKAYIRSVKRYLNVQEVSPADDLEGVENIDSLEAQKAFLQVSLEFFYLQDGDTYTTAQEEYLSNFALNDKQKNNIEQTVSYLYNAVGPEGMAEKYGYVPEEPEPADSADGNAHADSADGDICGEPASGELEKVEISNPLMIGEGEAKTFRNMDVYINAPISCAGTLAFENCAVHYGGDGIVSKIELSGETALSFTGCEIKRRAQKNGSGTMLIEKKDGEKGEPVVFTTCRLIDCSYFLGVAARIERCQIIHPGVKLVDNRGVGCCEFYRSKIMISAVQIDRYSASICGEIHMSQCVVFEDGIRLQDSNYHEVFGGSGSKLFENCMFRYITMKLFSAANADSACRLCVFDSCEYLGDVGGLFDSCRFDHCGGVEVWDETTIRYCQFNRNCEGRTLIDICTCFAVTIEGCEFNGWKSKKCKGMIRRQDGYSNDATYIRNCIFRGIEAERYVVCTEIAGHIESPTNVSDCQFINCTKGDNISGNRLLINTRDYYLGHFKKEKWEDVARVTNCPGYDSAFTGPVLPLEYTPLTATAAGTPLGPTEPVGLSAGA